MLRSVGLLISWAVCLIAALATGWSAVWLIVYAYGLLLVLSFAWCQLNVTGIQISRQARADRIQVGETFEEGIQLSARRGPVRWWPRLWLELHDASDLPGYQVDRVFSLLPGASRRWDLRSTCVRRGRFHLGPIYVASGDPFGLFRTRRLLAPRTSVLVYPRAVALARFGGVPGDLPGGALQGLSAPNVTPNASTVREYRPGDAFNRIHWPTTARTGRVMVREFELDPATDVWLILDLAAENHAGSGTESTEEYAVTVTASLARHLLEQGRSVGFVSPSVTLPSDRGPRQLERILEVLAVVRATSSMGLDTLLPAETNRFARSSTLVVITPSTSEGWVSFYRGLNRRGVSATAVLIEAATFDFVPSPLLLVSSLAAAHIPAYLVKRGESIEQALAAPRTSAPGARP